MEPYIYKINMINISTEVDIVIIIKWTTFKLLTHWAYTESEITVMSYLVTTRPVAPHGGRKWSW